jgi:hypothetical protein
MKRIKPQTTVTLLPTYDQRDVLDDTWARCGRLMNVSQDLLIRGGEISHTIAGPVIADELAKHADADGLSTKILTACIRTVSRHLRAYEDDPARGCIDWTARSSSLGIYLSGRSAGVLYGGELSIETAQDRLQVPCELVEGDTAVLRDRALCFYLMRDAAGAYSLQYRPGELAAARRSKTLVERASA